MFCSKCKTKVTNSTKFCQNCGEKLESKGTGSSKIVMIVLVILIISGIITVFIKNNIKENNTLEKRIQGYWQQYEVETGETSYIKDISFYSDGTLEMTRGVYVQIEGGQIVRAENTNKMGSWASTLGEYTINGEEIEAWSDETGSFTVEFEFNSISGELQKFLRKEYGEVVEVEIDGETEIYVKRQNVVIE